LIRDGAVEVNAAPRGHALVLDGSTSADPQDDADDLSFRWEFRRASTSAWTVIPDIGDGVIEPLPFEFKSANVTTSGVPVLLELRTVATDDDGNVSTPSATRTLTLTNVAPVARLGSKRTYPAGGFPWDPDGAFEIRVDSVSRDDDGDSLLLDWTVRGLAAITSTDATSITLSVPSEPGRVVVGLRVYDGLLTSSLETEVISIREPSLWSFGTSGYPRVLDPTSSKVNSSGVGEKVMSLLDLSAQNEGIWVAVLTKDDSQPDFLTVGSWPDFSTGTSTSAFPDGGEPAIATDAAHSRVWTVHANLNPDEDFEVREWAVQFPGPTLTPGAYASIPLVGTIGNAFPSGLPGLIAVDGDGTAWATWTLSSALFAVAPSTGEIADPVTFPGKGFMSVVRRPGPAGEVWALAAPSFFAAASGEAVIIRLTEPQVAVTFDRFATAMAWADEDEIWIAAANQGMVRLHADTLLAAGYEASIVAEFPEAPDAFSFLADTETAEVWSGNYFDPFLSLTQSDGQSFSFESIGVPQFVDPVGVLWLSSGGGAIRCLSPDPARVLAEASVLSPINVVSELAGGGAWIPTTIPFGLAHVAEDGTVLAFHDAFTVDGALPTGHLLFNFVLDQTGGGWARATSQAAVLPNLVRVDLRTDPPALTTVLNEGDGTPALAGNTFLAASRPGDFVWAIAFAASAIVRVDETGTVQTETDLVGENSLMGASSLVTGDLCLASQDLVTGELVVRLTRAGLGSVELARLPLGSERPFSVAITSAAAGGPDLCYVAMTTPGAGGCAGTTTIHAWPMEGASPPAYLSATVDDVEGFSIAARRELIWVSGPTCTNGEETFGIVQLHAAPPGVTEHARLPAESVVYLR
jgi:hypothetical protein